MRNMDFRFRRAIAVIAGLFTGIVGHQLSELSQKAADERIAEANARGDEARALAASSNERAKESELRLERLRRQVAPRQLKRDIFLAALNGQPKARVELVYLRDDPECFDVAQQIWRALQDARWDVLPPAPILQSASPGALQSPTAVTVDGQPAGVTVVTDSVSERESNAGVEQMTGQSWEKTPWTVLTYALVQSLGQAGGHGGGPNSPPKGTLRVVVAPR
ncbi:hypothetical protein [Caballeronia cordobensis]|uniref:hypothetical protein n=1 Tax=Caballeronia cordobensis TaxID=1353886 RepID=UPI00117811C5|nr:hypothetical protein [Caballeronia cordobensis]